MQPLPLTDGVGKTTRPRFFCVCGQAIVEARWSPDKDTVALGSEDTDLYLYSTGGNYDLIATAGKHKHPVRGWYRWSKRRVVHATTAWDIAWNRLSRARCRWLRVGVRVAERPSPVARIS